MEPTSFGYTALHWVHLVAAATWLGGLIVLATSIVALRKAGAERSHLVAVARMFAKVSWTAMIVAVITGIGQMHALKLPWSYGKLHMKLGLVGLAIALALAHQLTAKSASPAARGMIQAAILLVSLGIFAAAVRL